MLVFQSHSVPTRVIYSEIIRAYGVNEIIVTIIMMLEECVFGALSQSGMGNRRRSGPFSCIAELRLAK